MILQFKKFNLHVSKVHLEIIINERHSIYFEGERGALSIYIIDQHILCLRHFHMAGISLHVHHVTREVLQCLKLDVQVG